MAQVPRCPLPLVDVPPSRQKRYDDLQVWLTNAGLALRYINYHTVRSWNPAVTKRFVDTLVSLIINQPSLSTHPETDIPDLYISPQLSMPIDIEERQALVSRLVEECIETNNAFIKVLGIEMQSIQRPSEFALVPIWAVGIAMPPTQDDRELRFVCCRGDLPQEITHLLNEFMLEHTMLELAYYREKRIDSQLLISLMVKEGGAVSSLDFLKLLVSKKAFAQHFERSHVRPPPHASPTCNCRNSREQADVTYLMARAETLLRDVISLAPVARRSSDVGDSPVDGSLMEGPRSEFLALLSQFYKVQAEAISMSE